MIAREPENAVIGTIPVVMSQREIGQRSGLSRIKLRRVLKGDEQMTPEITEKLKKAITATLGLWLEADD